MHDQARDYLITYRGAAAKAEAEQTMNGPDIAAVVEAIREISTEVRWLKRAVQALLDHNGISLDGPKDSATDGETNGMRFGRVLVVTADLRLRDRLLTLVQGIGLEVNVAVHPEVAERYYRVAPLVLAGADQATACLRAGLPIWGLCRDRDSRGRDGPGWRLGAAGQGQPVEGGEDRGFAWL